MDSRKNIDQLFKGEFEKFELRPSADVWNRIEQDLNNTHKTPVRIPYARYAAILFMFITLTFITIPVSHNHFSASLALTESPATGSEISSNPGIVFPQTASISSDIQIPPTALSLPRQSEATEITASVDLIGQNIILPYDQQSDFIIVHSDPETEETAESLNNSNRIYNSVRSMPVFGFNKVQSEQKDFTPVNSHHGDPDYLDMDMSGLYIGVSASYNQTSIIEYNNQFRDERPIQPSLKFGASKGLTVGYNFNNKFGLQVEYIYNSIEGQNYIMTQDGQITQKSLSLVYDEIPITANIKVGRISDLTNKPVVLNYTAGIQYGKLKEYRLPQEQRYESTDNLLKENQVSLVLGLSYDIYVQDNLNFSIGARGTISNDISQINEPLSDYAKRNFVFGLKAGLNYTFR